MKSKEEIEQLADDYATSIYGYHNENHNTYLDCKRHCIEFYTQCQKDMVKDVEYWQVEFEHWHQQAMEMADKYNELLNKQD